MLRTCRKSEYVVNDTETSAESLSWGEDAHRVTGSVCQLRSVVV